MHHHDECDDLPEASHEDGAKFGREAKVVKLVQEESERESWPALRVCSMRQRQGKVHWHTAAVRALFTGMPSDEFAAAQRDRAARRGELVHNAPDSVIRTV